MMFGSSLFNCFVQTVQVDHATLAYLAEHLHVGGTAADLVSQPHLLSVYLPFVTPCMSGIQVLTSREQRSSSAA
jgi:hypothetical protein